MLYIAQNSVQIPLGSCELAPGPTWVSWPTLAVMESEEGDTASTSEASVRHDLRPEDFTSHVVIGRGK